MLLDWIKGASLWAQLLTSGTTGFVLLQKEWKQNLHTLSLSNIAGWNMPFLYRKSHLHSFSMAAMLVYQHVHPTNPTNPTNIPRVNRWPQKYTTKMHICSIKWWSWSLYISWGTRGKNTKSVKKIQSKPTEQSKKSSREKKNGKGSLEEWWVVFKWCFLQKKGVAAGIGIQHLVDDVPFPFRGSWFQLPAKNALWMLLF